MQPDSSAVPRDCLFKAIVAEYALCLTGIHGATHWARVCENGLRLAAETYADREVVILFALFHDACRENDGHDPDHGPRGAELARRYHGDLFELDAPRFELLYEACAKHTGGATADDPTIGTCWDADRLDLGRVGLEPHPRYLSTPAAKRREMVSWATGRSQMNYVPDLLRDEWGYQS